MQLANLKTKYLGRSVFYYEKIDSTQKEITRRAEKGKIENGTLIYADLQTEGIGTHGRRWYTSEKNNIAFSVFLELNCNIDLLNGLTRKIAEIILDIFEYKYDIYLQIKSPNDIYYNQKKLGGILTETKVEKNRVKSLIVGIGININKDFFEEDIKDIATSINKEFQINIDTKEFMSEFCNRFETEINRRIN